MATYLGEVGRCTEFDPISGLATISVGLAIPTGATVVVVDAQTGNYAAAWTDVRGNAYRIDRVTALGGGATSDPEIPLPNPVNGGAPPQGTPNHAQWVRVSSMYVADVIHELHVDDWLHFNVGVPPLPPDDLHYYFHGAIALAFTGLRASDYLLATHGCSRQEYMSNGGEAPALSRISLSLPGHPVSRATGNGRLEVLALMAATSPTNAQLDPIPSPAVTDLALVDDGSSPSITWLDPIGWAYTYGGAVGQVNGLWVGLRFTDGYSNLWAPAHLQSNVGADEGDWYVTYQLSLLAYLDADWPEPSGEVIVDSAPRRVGMGVGDTAVLSEAVPAGTRVFMLAAASSGGLSVFPVDPYGNVWVATVGREAVGIGADPTVSVAVWTSQLATGLHVGDDLTVTGAQAVFAYTMVGVGPTPEDATYLVPVDSYLLAGATLGVRDSLQSHVLFSTTENINAQDSFAIEHGRQAILRSHGVATAKVLGLGIWAASRQTSRFSGSNFAPTAGNGTSLAIIDQVEHLPVLPAGHELDVYILASTMTATAAPHRQVSPTARIDRFDGSLPPPDRYQANGWTWAFALALYLPAVEVAGVISGVDVAATLEFLHRSYQVGTSVYVGTSRDQGLTWPPVLLTSSARLNGTPTLAVDRWGNLYCWWDTDSTAFCFLSEDWGQTWATWASLLGLRHVRAIVGLEWHLAIGYDSVGGRLLLYGSRDYFQTWQGPLASVPVAVAQVAGLGLDRHGYYHVVYQEADLLHAYSQDPMVADGLETLLAAAGTPASIFGAPGSVATTGALVAFWTGGGILQVQPTGPGYLGLVEAAVGPGLGVGLQVVGLTLDHHENGWLVGQTGGGGLNTRWTNDWGKTWEDP